MFFADSLHGWIGTGKDIILRTTDSGENWIKVSTQTNNSISKIFFIDKDTGWCTCWSGEGKGNGVICKSTDGGVTWIKKFDNINMLKSIYFSSHNTGWAVGSAGFVGGQIFITTNGGDTWDVNYNFTGDIRPLNVLFTNEDTGFVIGGEAPGRVFKTTNRGKDWHEIQIYANAWDGDNFFDISFSDPQNGILGSQDGRLFETNDCGETWRRIFASENGAFFAVVDRKPRYWIADHQAIINSSNSGINWFPQYQDYLAITGIYFVNDSLGWAVGSSGNSDSLVILKTVNGGVPNSGPPKIPQLIYPVNNAQFYSYPLTFTWDLIQYSAYELQISLDSLFNKLEVLDTTIVNYFRYTTLKAYSTYYWRVRSRNLNGYSEWSNVFKFTTGYVIGIKDNVEAPYVFSLKQNYPNPFNPSTTINYSLPHAGNVKLTVYNSIGSKVATLVNEYKPAGSYSVHFNASNLASGIYLYRLESGNYNTAKKLILMK